MRKLKQSLENNGYDPEEAYFHKVNRELIDKMKQKEHAKIQEVEAKMLKFKPKSDKNQKKAA